MRTRKQQRAWLLGQMEQLESDDCPIKDEDEREKKREELRNGLWGIYIAEERKGKKK